MCPVFRLRLAHRQLRNRSRGNHRWRPSPHSQQWEARAGLPSPDPAALLAADGDREPLEALDEGRQEPQLRLELDRVREWEWGGEALASPEEGRQQAADEERRGRAAPRAF